MWWLYFAASARTLPATTHRTHGRRFVRAYGHYFVFAAAAAEGAGPAAYADHVTHAAGASALSATVAGAAVTVPAAVFLLTVWAVHLRPHQKTAAEWIPYPSTAVAILAAAASPAPALLTGALPAVLVAVGAVGTARRR
jgi:low temperature requirement protein LtrA